jgi:hypothetical protein
MRRIRREAERRAGRDVPVFYAGPRILPPPHPREAAVALGRMGFTVVGFGMGEALNTARVL